MDSAEFRDAVAYSLRCVHQESLIHKAKQGQAGDQAGGSTFPSVQSVQWSGVFTWFPTGYGKSISFPSCIPVHVVQLPSLPAFNSLHAHR